VFDPVFRPVRPCPVQRDVLRLISVKKFVCGTYGLTVERI
jgi:hypothetical protein